MHAAVQPKSTEKSTTSSAMYARFTLHLKVNSIYAEESVHSTRHGKMIKATQHHATIEQVQEAAVHVQGNQALLSRCAPADVWEHWLSGTC